MRIANYTFIALIIFLSACAKEKMTKESLSGKWKYSSVRYVRILQDTIVKDETLNESGYFDFTNDKPEENRGGTVYGDYASGRAKLPFFYQSNLGMPDNPNFLDGTVLFSQTIHNKPKVSYQDKYYGIMLFAPDNTNGYTTYHVHMTMVNENTITLRGQITQESNFDDLRNENGFYLTLTR